MIQQMVRLVKEELSVQVHNMVSFNLLNMTMVIPNLFRNLKWDAETSSA